MIYDGLRVVDFSTGIAGGYCSKLLTDLGADLVKVEPADGDPLRHYSASGSVGRDGDPDGALFRYLHTSQHSVLFDERVPDRVRAADVVIESFRPGEAEAMGIIGVAPVTVSISPFGRGGPDSEVMLTEEVLQARSGSLSNHGHMDRVPLTVGGRLGEYVTGAYAALGTMTAWRRASRTGAAEHVDVSMLEAMQLTFVTTPTLMATFPGGRKLSFRWVMLPGNEPTGDGHYVGITAVTKTNWLSLLRVIGREDLAGDEELATMLGRFVRAKEVNDMVRGWTMQFTAEEVVDRCAAERVPAAALGNGQTLPAFEQLVGRNVFVDQPGAPFLRPRAPFRFSTVPDRPLTPAPRLGEHSDQPIPHRRELTVERRPIGERPLSGIIVLDFTAFWSGPYATAWLSAMGADVIKVEALQRPDGIRFSAAVKPRDDPLYYEKAALFAATNLGKRGITLDLGQPDGIDLARRLIATADVVCENFTPRVMDGFGLDEPAVRAIKPDVVYLRLPAFGLTGPWRDRPGFAQTMEQMTGMAWVTGYEDGPPIIPGGMVDPAVGVHTALALIAALEHRDRTGEGQLVEMPMIEVAAAMTAEQVAEYSAYGVLLERRGDGGVFRCAEDDDGEDGGFADRRRAESVASPSDSAGGRASRSRNSRRRPDEPEQWIALDFAADPMPSEERAAWCAARSAEQAAHELLDAGIAAAPMVPAFAALDDPQLRARAFFEPVDHPLLGVYEYPGWPMRFSAGPHRYWREPAPMLGQHTEQVLRERLGLDDAELARLRAANVIGTEPLGTV